jgi:putative ABC transport system substrate-binding protein
MVFGDFRPTASACRAVTRRWLLAILGIAVIAGPFRASAQATTKPRRIGVLARASFSTFVFARLFPAALAELGYHEGVDVVLDWRSADGDAEALPKLAAGLVAAGADVILAVTNSETAAARSATTTIPIIMLAATNPVETGLVASLARPGGNVTGSAWSAPETAGKALQILKEAVPDVRRVGFVLGVGLPEQAIYADAMRAAASVIGVTFDTVLVGRTEDGVDALRRFHRGVGDALVVSFSAGRIEAVLEYAAQNRLPTLCTVRGWIEAGGLIAYIPSAAEAVVRTARYVDRILKGARPRDLPVEQPTRFELVVNLKTAKALGLTLPPALLARADELIE